MGFAVDLVVCVGGGSEVVFGAGDDEIVYGREDNTNKIAEVLNYLQGFCLIKY